MDTRQRIMRTALAVFLRKGYDRASMNEIAREAGVTKGGIYHHFESKEHLFREALSFITSEMDRWSTARFRDVRSAQDLLAALFGSIGPMREAFENIVGGKAERHPYSFLEILVNAARRDEGVRREMGAMYSRTRGNMTRLLLRAQQGGEIRGDIDCSALALEITALMEGILLLSVIDETVDLDEVGERIYANMWRMVAA